MIGVGGGRGGGALSSGGNSKIGYVCGVSAAFFWGFHAVLARHLISELPGLVIAVVRLYVAVIGIYIFLKIFDPDFQTVKIKNPLLVFTAIFGMALNFLFFHLGLEYTTASNAMLIESSAPIFVLIFTVIFLKAKINTLNVFAIFMAFAGVLLVVMGDLDINKKQMFGDILEMLAAITWAVFIIGSSRLASLSLFPKKRLAYLMTVFIIAAIPLTPILLVMDYHISMLSLLYLVVLGLLPTALAYALWYEAAARISVVSAALVFNLSIIFTLLNAHFILGEAITLLMILGALLIIGGVILSQIADERNENRGNACDEIAEKGRLDVKTY